MSQSSCFVKLEKEKKGNLEKKQKRNTEMNGVTHSYLLQVVMTLLISQLLSD